MGVVTMKVIKTREQALDVIKSSEHFAIEQDMWSVVIFHKDMITQDVCCEVSYFDDSFRKDRFLQNTKDDLKVLKVDSAIYVGTACMFSQGMLF